MAIQQEIERAAVEVIEPFLGALENFVEGEEDFDADEFVIEVHAYFPENKVSALLARAYYLETIEGVEMEIWPSANAALMTLNEAEMVLSGKQGAYTYASMWSMASGEKFFFFPDDNGDMEVVQVETVEEALLAEAQVPYLANGADYQAPGEDIFEAELVEGEE